MPTYRVGGPHKSADCLTLLYGPAGKEPRVYTGRVAQGLDASPVRSEAQRAVGVFGTARLVVLRDFVLRAATPAR